MGHLPLVDSRIIQDEQRQSAASEGFVPLTCLQSLGNTGNKQQAGIRPPKGGKQWVAEALDITVLPSGNSR